MASDALGSRMKSQYEDRTRACLPRRTYTIVRVDGKAFHSFTRQSEKPFDFQLMQDMDQSAIAVCNSAMGVRCAYGQSDEYSFLLTDFEANNTEAWFDGNIQKIASVAASTFASAFSKTTWGQSDSLACFDARVFTIPDRTEVENYFIWRQQDATRNAILMAGYACFSPKQMHGKNTSEVQEMLFQERQMNFNEYPASAKRGRVIFKEEYDHEGTVRSRWGVDLEMPILTQERAYLCGRMRIPQHPGHVPDLDFQRGQ